MRFAYPVKPRRESRCGNNESPFAPQFVSIPFPSAKYRRPLIGAAGAVRAGGGVGGGQGEWILRHNSPCHATVARQREIDESLPEALRSKPNTPSDINWWRKLEVKYSRDLRAEMRALRAAAEKQERPIIGFFGLSTMSYGRLQQVGEKSGQGDTQAREDAAALENLPCDCTD